MFFKSLLIASMSLYATLQASEQRSEVFKVNEYISKPGGILRMIETDDRESFQQVFDERKSDEEGISNEMLEQGLCCWISYSNYPLKLIDVAGFFHATEIFKFLVMNGETPTSNTLSSIVARRDVDTSKVCELIRLCEDRGATIDVLVFERAFKSRDEDLFAYVCSKYSFLHDDSPNGLTEASTFICHPRDNAAALEMNLSKGFRKNFLELQSELVGYYPVLFEAFGENELNSLHKIVETTKFRARLLGGINHSIKLPILEKFAKERFPKLAMPDAILLTTKHLLGDEKADLKHVVDQMKTIYGDAGIDYDAMTEFVEPVLRACCADAGEVSVKDFIGMAEYIEGEIFRQNSFIKTFGAEIEFWKWQLEICDGDFLCDEFIRTEVQKFEDGLKNASEQAEEESEEGIDIEI